VAQGRALRSHNAAPANWEHRSFQVVLATRIIQGSDAMPRIAATHFW
jgi:hypothetical protein